MIQLRQIYKKAWDEEETTELAKVLNFLGEENIEFDLEPPKKFVKYKTVGRCTYVISEELK